MSSTIEQHMVGLYHASSRRTFCARSGTCHHTLARDFNPIEEAFAKIKGLLLRKVEARTRQALVEAICTAISTISAQDAQGFFEHCGYRPRVQLL